jgi:acyl-CoA thioester hydrolase
MATSDVRFRVRYAETDQMGVVYHANYLVWMEMGRVELCRELGIRYRDMEQEDGVLLAVAAASCRYLFPARYDDEILVRTAVARATTRLLEFSYEVRESVADRVLATGVTTHIFCGPDLRPCKLPEKYREAFGVSRPPRGSEPVPA